MKYPNVVKAVQAAQKSQWDIGFALLKDCGPPSRDGVTDNSFEKLTAVADELLEHCNEDYSVKYLAMMRSTAHAWSRSSRDDLPVFSIARIAGDPETLKKIKAKAKDRRLTTHLTSEIKRQMDEVKDKRDIKRKKPQFGKKKEKDREPIDQGLSLASEASSVEVAGEALLNKTKEVDLSSLSIEALNDVVDTALSGVAMIHEALDLIRPYQKKAGQHTKVSERSHLRVVP
jgi:hypothetical protein